MSHEIKVTFAEADLRPKTKFLRVQGTVMVESFQDSIEIDRAEPPGFNPSILLLNLIIIESNGPKKIQPKPFYYSEILLENSSYTHVQIVHDEESVTYPITILKDAASGPALVSELIGRTLRVYKEGDEYTDDFVQNRVNIITNDVGAINKIWFD